MNKKIVLYLHYAIYNIIRTHYTLVHHFDFAAKGLLWWFCNLHMMFLHVGPRSAMTVTVVGKKKKKRYR